jgi:hypothetical protein
MIWPFNVAKWLPWLERVQPANTRDAFPLARALRWIQLESGGNACAVGRVGGSHDTYPGHVYEAGLAQTYFETPSTARFGVTSAELRADCSSTSMPDLTDERRLLHARVALETCKDLRARARAKLLLNGASLAESSDDFWAFVKLAHAAPALFDYVGAAKRHLGMFPTWRQFKGYVSGLSYESLYAINHGIAARAYDSAHNHTTYLDRVWNNCEAFAGGAGGFIELELLVVLAAIAFVLSHFVI